MNKKLYRSRKEKMLGGVCGGLAEYFNVDPTLVRIIFVVSLFAGGTGVIAYIILLNVVPQEPIIFPAASTESKETEQSSSDMSPNEIYFKILEEKRQKRTVFFGAGLVIIGIIFLADNFIRHFYFSDLFSLILIGIGIALLLNSRKTSIS